MKKFVLGLILLQNFVLGDHIPTSFDISLQNECKNLVQNSHKIESTEAATSYGYLLGMAKMASFIVPMNERPEWGQNKSPYQLLLVACKVSLNSVDIIKAEGFETTIAYNIALSVKKQ